MNAYQLLLFVHVVAAVGMFAAIAAEAVALAIVQRADSSEQARLGIGLIALPHRLGLVALGPALGTGLGMMFMTWGHRPWMAVAFWGMVAMAILGVWVSGRRLRRLREALASDPGPRLSAAVRSLRSSNALAASVWLRVAIGVAILALMVLKPEIAGSAVILATGALGGLLAGRASLAAWRSRAMAAPGAP